MRSILIAGMFSLLLAGTAQEIVIPAAEFSATSVPPEQQKLIRAAGNLSGRSGDGGEPRVNGWFDYDFAVPETGWYEIVLPVTADRYEFLLDGCDYQYGDGTFYISAGKHRLRLRQEIYWTPFGKIDRIVIRPRCAGACETAEYLRGDRPVCTGSGVERERCVEAENPRGSAAAGRAGGGGALRGQGDRPLPAGDTGAGLL